MPAVPVVAVGRFIVRGGGSDPDSDRAHVLALQGLLKVKLTEFKEGMSIYQKPSKHPIPQIPMANAPYTVRITAKSKLGKVTSSIGRKARKQRRRGKSKKKLTGVRGWLSKKRSAYHMKKLAWAKGGEAFMKNQRTRMITFKSDAYRIFGKSLGSKTKTPDKGVIDLRKKIRESKWGKKLRIFKKGTKSKRPSLNLMDRVAPVRRERKRRRKKIGRKPAPKDILVKPGRLRRAAARGLRWNGSLSQGAVVLSWGIPSIGGGRFVNYASEVEINPNAGRLEGSALSPYVKRTIMWLQSEMRRIATISNAEAIRTDVQNAESDPEENLEEGTSESTMPIKVVFLSISG